MTEFELQLHECLEALTEGQWDLDECLRRHPEHADALRPMLLAATMTARASDVEPRPAFAKAARERFLIASGQRLQEAMDLEPSPAFFAAARMRFLMAAQRINLGERAAQPNQPRRWPVFGSPFRVLASGMVAVAIFMGASAYTVASASAALPGDWQYPIKLETERVRVKLAFSDGAKRHVKLDIAEERVSEIEQLTKRGRIIGPGVLGRLVEQTQPLVDDAKGGGWDPDEATRLEQVSERQQEVLAEAAGQIASGAEDQLSAAVDVSKTGQEVSKQILFYSDPVRPPAVLTPSVPLTSTPEPTLPPAASPTAAGTPGEATTPDTAATERSAVETPSATAVAPSKDIVISAEPAETRSSVRLYAVIVGSLTFLAPGSNDGWKMDDAPASGVPTLIKFSNQDSTSLLVINTLNGDMYWYITPTGSNAGRFDEVQMRIKRADGVFIASRDVLRTAYGDASDIPWYVMQSIAFIPPAPTATATASSTPEPSPTAAAR
jgi:Domain of unknown function (DUF5667)